MLRDMKKGTATGDNHLYKETLKAGEVTTLKTLSCTLNVCQNKQIPTVCKKDKMVIILENYIPTYLLSNIYKVLTKVLTKRLDKIFDENHPEEQVGFRRRFSMTDHIHVINQLKEKCRKYNIPLCITFVDYDKSFRPRFKNRGQKMCSSNS